MALLLIIKVLGDLFLYFAVVASLSNYISLGYPLFLPALIFAVSSGIGQILWNKSDSIPILKKDKKNILIKTLPLLLCLLTLVLVSTPTDLICLLPPLIYVAVIICKRNFSLIHREYIEYFKNMFIISIFIFLVCILSLNWKAYLLYESGFVICGVFLMRQLRLYTGNDLKGNFINLSSMLSILLISGGVFFVVFIIIQNNSHVWSVIKYPLSLMVFVISLILHGILWLFDSFLSLFKDDTAAPSTIDFPKYSDMIIEQADNSQANNPQSLQIIVIVAAAIVIFIIMFKMLGSLRNKAVEVQENSDYEIVIPTPSSKRLKKSKLFKTNREKVRLSYIKYLKVLEKEYGKFSISNTSKDIYDKTSEYFDGEKVLALRELYLHARYNLDKKVSETDVQNAKKLAKEITKKTSIFQ